MNLPRLLRRLARKTPRVSVLRLYGPIGMPGRITGSLTDHALAGAIEAAFDARPAAVALAINSPGGSPTQSALIAARIRRKAEERDVPVFAFCEDAAASGGYWLACAADEIHCDANSILGSIGVIYAGFGLHDLIGKAGVERRVHTAGTRKLMLDPFQPEKAEDVERLTELQGVIHRNFMEHVRARRGDRLADRADAEDLFSGEIWVGPQAVEAGLADGIGHLSPVMRDRFGEETLFREYAPRRTLGQRLGLPGAADLVAAAEARLMWSRYGV